MGEWELESVCVCVCVDRGSHGLQPGRDGDRRTLRGQGAARHHPLAEESFWGQG